MEGYSVHFAELFLEYMTKIYNLPWNFPLPYSNLLTHISKYFYICLGGQECLEIKIPTINENILKSLKFKPLPMVHWKHEDKISADDNESIKPYPYLEIIPPTCIEWFKEDVKAIKGQIASLQEGQYEFDDFFLLSSKQFLLLHLSEQFLLLCFEQIFCQIFFEFAPFDKSQKGGEEL